MKNPIIITIIVALVVGVGAFFGGMKYQQSKRVTFGGNFAGGQFQRRAAGNQQFGRNNQQAFRPVMGQIVSLDDKSISVKMPDGSSKIVLLGDNVSITKTNQASKTDLSVGAQVAVFGSQNSDGSISAQTVQLNPQLRMASPSARPQ